MVLLFRVPTLTNPNILIRLARNTSDIEQANDLIFCNYVSQGYWRNDRKEIASNRYLHLPARRVFVAIDSSTVIGTASVILDSRDGMPADKFQPVTCAQLRGHGEKLAEISGLAINQKQMRASNLIHFLVAYIFQYSFYYAGVDRFIVVCTEKHARFYERSYGFRQVDGVGFYSYVNVEAQMLTLNLVEGYEQAKDNYKNVAAANSFFRFMYRNAHPNMCFPPRASMRRSRELEWTAYAVNQSVAI